MDVANFGAVPMSQTVLVIAAHPDDEVLGCGGTIARHVAQGDAVHLIVMADGEGARNTEGKNRLNERQRAQCLASEILGVISSRSLAFPDNRMDGLPMLDVVQPLEALIREIQPATIYTHYHGDLNVDHRVTYQAVLTACRPQPGFSVREILSFEIMSSTEWAGLGSPEFAPNVFVDISDYWSKKRAALEAYSDEMRPVPHSRSVDHLDALARHRGACVGVERAESFLLTRCLR
jgi:LmbE family N-acetylglucosaminyl deacetylase